MFLVEIIFCYVPSGDPWMYGSIGAFLVVFKCCKAIVTFLVAIKCCKAQL